VQALHRVNRAGNSGLGASHLPQPRDPFIGAWDNRIGTVHLLQSRTNDAIFWFEKARTANPALSSVRSNLASACALKGDTERAAAQLTEA
jgi:hypothetical protein